MYTYIIDSACEHLYHIQSISYSMVRHHLAVLEAACGHATSQKVYTRSLGTRPYIYILSIVHTFIYPLNKYTVYRAYIDIILYCVILN